MEAQPRMQYRPIDAVPIAGMFINYRRNLDTGAIFHSRPWSLNEQMKYIPFFIYHTLSPAVAIVAANALDKL